MLGKIKWTLFFSLKVHFLWTSEEKFWMFSPWSLLLKRSEFTSEVYQMKQKGSLLKVHLLKKRNSLFEIHLSKKWKFSVRNSFVEKKEIQCSKFISWKKSNSFNEIHGLKEWSSLLKFTDWKNGNSLTELH